jgi:hypothetical protein
MRSDLQHTTLRCLLYLGIDCMPWEALRPHERQPLVQVLCNTHIIEGTNNHCLCMEDDLCPTLYVVATVYPLSGGVVYLEYSATGTGAWSSSANRLISSILFEGRNCVWLLQAPTQISNIFLHRIV